MTRQQQGPSDEIALPNSTAKLAARLRKLRAARRRRHHRHRGRGARRRTLTPAQKAEVLERTSRRCHVCGGRLRSGWRADHVLAHSNAGVHAVRNYLPAHATCNAYRWDYSPQECQWIVKIGIWARSEMERRHSALGREMLEVFHKHESQRASRAKKAERSGR